MATPTAPRLQHPQDPADFRLPDGQLFFLHIPKTAGSAFSQILKNQFSAHEVCPALYMPEFLDIPLSQRSAYRLISAHIGFDATTALERVPTCITILRDPIERVLSLYDYQRYFFKAFGADHANPTVAMVQKRAESLVNAGLLAFLDTTDPALLQSISNTQTLYVGGAGITDESLLLERATGNLRTFPFFGLAECMQESLDLFCYRFGLQPQRNVTINRTPGRKPKEDRPRQALERIAALNRADLALYRDATELFWERHAMMCADLLKRFPAPAPRDARATTQETEDEVALQNALSRHYEANSRRWASPPESAISRDLSFGPLGSGWHAWEGVAGRGWRWTGPAPDSTIDLHLCTDRPLRIRLQIAGIASWEILRGMRLSANGHDIPIRRLSLGRRWHWVFGVIPVSSLKTDLPFTRIGLHLPKTLPANVIHRGSEDPRVLGVAVRRIDIRPARWALEKKSRPQKMPNRSVF